MSRSPVQVFKAASTRIAFGGVPEVALYGPMIGGVVTNPGTAAEQGVPLAEILYVDIVGDATLGVSTTSYPLQPGQSYLIPLGLTTNVSVNAATSGHRFSAVLWQPPVPFPPTPAPGPFPPSGPTTVLGTIPSYLYQQYADDDDLQAFVESYNVMAQEYVDWFNTISLPIYTQQSGGLLDWVAQGLYGVTRPSLSSGRNRNVGPLNTYALNTWPLNVVKIVGPQNATVTSDDVFKRIITWGFYKGDGRHFNVRWLKRRIMRFLLGTNGVSYNVDQTYQVSVSFGTDGQVNITVITGVRSVVGGAILNKFALNTVAPNQLITVFRSVSTLPNTEILKEAIDSGVLELPFQFNYVVRV